MQAYERKQKPLQAYEEKTKALAGLLKKVVANYQMGFANPVKHQCNRNVTFSFHKVKNAGVRHVSLPLAAVYVTGQQISSNAITFNCLGEEITHLEAPCAEIHS